MEENEISRPKARLKAMISQPMTGLSDEVIEAVRSEAIAYLESLDYEVVSTLFDLSIDSLKEKGIAQPGVYFLAKSIDVMSLCDVVYFCNGWWDARGCRIEHEVAKEYGLKCLYEAYRPVAAPQADTTQEEETTEDTDDKPVLWTPDSAIVTR